MNKSRDGISMAVARAEGRSSHGDQAAGRCSDIGEPGRYGLCHHMLRGKPSRLMKVAVSSKSLSLLASRWMVSDTSFSCYMEAILFQVFRRVVLLCLPLDTIMDESPFPLASKWEICRYFATSLISFHAQFESGWPSFCHGSGLTVSC